MSMHPAAPREGHLVAWPSAVSSGSLTYEPFYGLKEKPFSLSSDPRFLFKSPSHTPAFERLLAGIRRREGLIALTGEIGTGKTTLCRAVIERLDRRTFSTFVPDPFVSREDLLRMLLVDFGVMSIDDVKSGRLRGASRAELSYPLYEFLNSLVPLQAFAVLIIDEAQNIPLPLLEEIRVLSDLEGREKLLQVVLVGQPELRANLKLPEMRQVDQRVSVRCELSPLRQAEVDGYIAWRLGVAAAGTGEGVQFTPEAVDAVFRASGGTPRLINRICDRSLHEGFLRGTRAIDAAAVVSALEELELPWSFTSALAPVVTTTTPIAPIDDANALAEFGTESAIVKPAATEKRWLRHLVLAVVAVLAGAIGAPYWPQVRASDGRLDRAAVPPLPVRPALGMAPVFAPLAAPQTDAVANAVPRVETRRYSIQVASFESDWRAERLVTRLAASGYRAYKFDFSLGDDDSWWQVAVGPYSTLAAAQADLDQIRLIPGYEDATLRR